MLSRSILELGKDNIIVYPIGRRLQRRRLRWDCVAGDFTGLADKPNVKECIDIAHELGKQFADGDIDRVEIIYHHFKSAGSQILTRKTFLPIDITEELNRDHERDLTSIATSKEARNICAGKGRSHPKRMRMSPASTTTSLSNPT